MTGDSLSGIHSQAISTLGSLPIIIGLAFSKRLSSPGRRMRGIILGLLGGLAGALGNIAYYQLLNSGAKAATVVPLTALYPIVTIAIAVPLLGEKLNWIQIVGVTLSILAIYFFNVPGEQGFFSSALLVAIIPMVLWGIAGFLQKVSTNDVSAELSALCFLAAMVPVAFGLLWLEPLDLRTLSSRAWIVLIALGLFLAIGNVAILAAFASNGKASIITPLGGLYPVISVPIALVFLGEKVGTREIVGILLALVSVAALSAESSSPKQSQPAELTTV